MHYKQVLKHGNSLCVIIPREICRDLGVHRGDNVKLKVVMNEKDTDGWGMCFLEIWPIKENNK